MFNEFNLKIEFLFPFDDYKTGLLSYAQYLCNNSSEGSLYTTAFNEWGINVMCGTGIITDETRKLSFNVAYDDQA